MATEAQRLIGISLTKIAQSRAHRGGVSLHKNLLVATVLQKARYIFMEEAYHMVHAGGYCAPPVHAPQPPQQQQSTTTSAAANPDYEQQNYDDDDDELVALTPEEAGISDEASLHELLQPACVRCHDKENQSAAANQHQPEQQQTNSNTELTYLDLDKPAVLRERSKRRRAVTEWETEEAVLSILPKRSKPDEDDADDSVFLDEAALFSDCVAREAAAAAVAAAAEEETSCSSSSSSNSSSAMEIDRITSLVSIFSFGGLATSGVSVGVGEGKLSRSVSTPDLCSAQAKESAVDALSQRPFLAMTV